MINSRIRDYSTLHVNVKSLRTGYSRDLSGEVWWLCLQKRSNFLSLFCFSLLRTHFLCINSLSDKKNVRQKLTNFSKGQNLGFFWLKWKKLSLTNNLVRQKNSLTVLTDIRWMFLIKYILFSVFTSQDKLATYHQHTSRSYLGVEYRELWDVIIHCIRATVDQLHFTRVFDAIRDRAMHYAKKTCFNGTYILPWQSSQSYK